MAVTDDIKKATDQTSTDSKKRAKDIMQRFQQLEQAKAPWDTLYQDVADFVLINREDMKQTEQDGKEQSSRVYDGTPLAALQLFVDGVYGYMVSPAIQWFRLALADPDINEDPEVRTWLQDTEQRLYTAFSRSNFYDIVRGLIEDGSSIGTGVLYAEEDIDNNRIQFVSIHPGEVFIAQNKYGSVDTLFRKFKTTARQVIQRFGEDKVSQRLRDAYRVNPYTETSMIHAVFPRSDRDVTLQDSDNMPWASVWIELGSDSDRQGHILDEGGFVDFPYIVWRYKTTGKEVYGRSPAMDAIIDIKMLNKMSKTIIARAQLEAEPPLNINAADEGRGVEYRPRGKNYYSDPQMKIEPMQIGGSFIISAEVRQDARNIVEKHFRTDFFFAQSSSTREMTATQSLNIQAEQAAVLGPALGRMTSEGFSPIIDRTFALELEAGRISEPPAKLLAHVEETGQPIDIEYLGPLVQTQKKHFATAGIQRGLADVTPIFEIAPESVTDRVDWDETVEDLLMGGGFPQKNMRTDEVVALIRQQRQQAQQAQVQAEQMLQMTEGIKNMADADQKTDGGVVEQLEEAV
jgi:hypothetical protein